MKKIFSLIIFLLCLSSFQAGAQYDKDVFSFRGRNALQDGKYAQAIENFNILARLDTTDYWTFFYRGIAKYNLGDIRGSQQDFNTSIRLNPIFTNGYHYRAITYSRMGQYDKAFDDFKEAIRLRPGNEGLYYSRGVTYFLAQDFENAEKDFNHYIRRQPRDPSAYLNRGATYLYLKDTLKAFQDYNRAIKLDRFDPEGYIRRGRLYAEQNKYQDAISDMDIAIEIDSTNTFAYFNRALMHYDSRDFNKAMSDLNRVLKDEPGNALTLYNRSLIYAQVGDYEGALADMDHVISINPGNVLAYFNRASYFIEMGRYRDALEDYNKSIELYPDFAKAYLNRSYVENLLGQTKASKRDYDTAQAKIREYRDKNATDEGSFADTTKKYSSLIALDADFAKKDFDDELLQHRDIDIRLKQLYRYEISQNMAVASNSINRRYENPLMDRFVNESPLPMKMTNEGVSAPPAIQGRLENFLYGDTSSGAGSRTILPSEMAFIKGVYEVQNKRFNQALKCFDDAIALAQSDAERDRYYEFYKAFFHANRASLRADMIDFIASIQSNVQTLTMDDRGATRARVSDQVNSSYDYSEAIDDMLKAIDILPDIPYFHFNLANLYCLDSQHVQSIAEYDKAVELYPQMGDAYYNRGLVLIYLKDKEKGCIDLSRAGELGVSDAYSVISKYCEEK